MLEGIRPGTENRCELLKIIMEKGMLWEFLSESGEAMRGKSDEEKEQIAKEYIQIIQNSANSKTSG